MTKRDIAPVQSLEFNEEMSTFRLSSTERGDSSAVGGEPERTPGTEVGPRGLFSCDSGLGSSPRERRDPWWGMGTKLVAR